MPIQVGGGLRDAKTVEAAFSAGAERVVLGTAALRDPEMAAAIASAHGERVVVSVDARSGKVAVEGWTEASDLGAAEVIAELSERGVRRFLCTPVEVDGMMEGPDLDSLREAAARHRRRADLLGRGRDARRPSRSLRSWGSTTSTA